MKYLYKSIICYDLTLPLGSVSLHTAAGCGRRTVEGMYVVPFFQSVFGYIIIYIYTDTE